MLKKLIQLRIYFLAAIPNDQSSISTSAVARVFSEDTERILRTWLPGECSAICWWESAIYTLTRSFKWSFDVLCTFLSLIYYMKLRGNAYLKCFVLIWKVWLLGLKLWGFCVKPSRENNCFAYFLCSGSAQRHQTSKCTPGLKIQVIAWQASLLWKHEKFLTISQLIIFFTIAVH